MVNGFNPFSNTILHHRDSHSVVLPPNTMPSPLPSETHTSRSSYLDHVGGGEGTPHTPPSYPQPPPPSSFALQDVVRQFRDQPELLQLILQSKVEEDKRRAEEAKLRAKEIDLYLQQRDSVQGLALRPLRFSRQSDGINQSASSYTGLDSTSADITPKSSSPQEHHSQNVSPYGRVQHPSSPPRHSYSISREHTPGALAPRHLEYRRHSAVELPPFRYPSPIHRLSSSSSENDFKRRRMSMDQIIGYVHFTIHVGWK